MAAYMPRLGLEVPRAAFLLLLVSNLAGFSAALYEDQAGKFDWRQQYVGRVTTARWEGQTGPARRLLLATNHHLVAALNPRNGHLLWRQQLPNQEGPLNFFLHQGSATVTVSGRLARAWDLALGVLAWETLLPPGRVQGALLLGNDPHHLVVLQMKTVTLLTLTGGHISWSVTLPDSVVWEAMLSAQAKSLYVIGRSADGYVTSLSLELDDGSSVDKTMTTAPAGLSSLVKECAPYDATSLVCLPHKSALPNHLYLIPLSSSSNLLSSNVSLASLGLVPELSSAGPVLWGVSEAWERFGGRTWGSKSLILRLGPKAFVLLGFNNGNVTVLKEFEQTDLVQLVAVGPDLSTVVTLTQKNSTAYSTSLISGESGLRFVDSAMTFNVETALKTVDKMFINAYLKKDNMAAYRLLLQTTDDSLFLVQQPGRVVWLREEALAEVVTMTTVDLPLSATDAELEGEFGKKAVSQDGLFALLWRRLTSQVQLASTWVVHAWIIITSTAWTSRRDRAVLEEDRQRAMGESGRSGLVPSRDSFNTHKMLVMVTASGKLLGLESRSGAILWRLWAPNLDAKRGSVTGDAKDKDLTVGGWKLGGLFVQRGSAHFPHPPLASLLLQHQETGKSHLMIFNPVYGVLSSIPEPKLKRPVLQAAVLNHMGPNFTRPLLLLHDDLSVSCFPSSPSFHSLIDSMASSIFFYIVDPAHRSICGFQFLKSMKAHHIWEVAIPEGHKVLEVAGKHLGETVHSQGRVLGDRSVLYKYVNPHLVAVAMQVAENQPEKASVMLYLLDGVTGRVVYSVTLRRARSPLRLVHTENWLVVLYWNPKARRSELWILELYEGIARHNETAFSSLERPFAGPLALQQAYVLPGRAGPLQVTLTERGITSRHILVALQSGGIVSLPKAFLDPRRPEVPGEQSREEGLIPYSPELPLPTEWFINYNQTVAAVRGLHTAVTGLESTCLVIAYGLDLFSTRVHPSKMFDILKDDFDFILISVVSVSLCLAAILSKRLAQVKMLNRSWR